MSKLSKFGIVAGIVALVAILLLIVKFQYDLITKQNTIEKSLVEMKQLKDEIIRSQAQYATKEDIEKLAKSLNLDLKVIKDDLKTLGAEVKGINTFLASTPGYHGHDLPSDHTTPNENPPPNGTPCPPNGVCPNNDPYGYLSNAQHLNINEPFNANLAVPFGQSTFKAWQERPWDLEVYPRDYRVNTVIGQDKEGRHYTYNQFTVEVKGKKYNLPIKESKFVEQYPESSFSWSPRLMLSVDAGAVITEPKAELTPGVQVSLFSRGRTKNDPEWTFVNVGVGYHTQTQRAALTVSPVNYNLGKQLPLVDNLHIGPTVAIDTKGGVAVMGGIKVGL